MNKTFKEFVNDFYVGIIGYSDESKFDLDDAKEKIKIEFDKLEKKYNDKKIVIVSGLTNIGIPGIAYKEATHRKWKTIGISAKEAEQYKLFNVDIKIILGEKFGDESSYFINYCDIILKFGGGKQSKKEFDMAKTNNKITKEIEIGKK